MMSMYELELVSIALLLLLLLLLPLPHNIYNYCATNYTTLCEPRTMALNSVSVFTSFQLDKYPYVLYGTGNILLLLLTLLMNANSIQPCTTYLCQMLIMTVKSCERNEMRLPTFLSIPRLPHFITVWIGLCASEYCIQRAFSIREHRVILL